jgi:hypothetical protein
MLYYYTEQGSDELHVCFSLDIIKEPKTFNYNNHKVNFNTQKQKIKRCEIYFRNTHKNPMKRRVLKCDPEHPPCGLNSTVTTLTELSRTPTMWSQ